MTATTGSPRVSEASVTHARAGRLLGLATACAALAAATVLCARLAWARFAELLATSTPADATQLAPALQSLLLAGAAVLLLWLFTLTAIVTCCGFARGAAATWHAGERLAARLAPAAWRGAITAVIGVGLGTAVVGSAAAVSPIGGPPHEIGLSAAPISGSLGPGVEVVPPGDTATDSSNRNVEVAEFGTGIESGTSYELSLGWDALIAPSTSAATSPAAPTHRADTANVLPIAAQQRGEIGTEVVVQSGDSLWRIAAAHLPDDATATEIDAEWRRWYAENRDEIGPNPNLLFPGQLLTPPK